NVYEMWVGPMASTGSANVKFKKEYVRLYWSKSAPAGERAIRISKCGDLPPSAKTHFEIQFTYDNWDPINDPIPIEDPYSDFP
ncbi:hypothetical protein KY340_00565, partial [Candidatus Woesearchaeota archaeon]|nr:hypothetical protein [Candidatus Woesearchaeota archaeon]